LIENPKLFHNNLPIRATKTGGFFYVPLRASASLGTLTQFERQ